MDQLTAEPVPNLICRMNHCMAGMVPQTDALLPSTSEWCRAVGLCRRSQSQVIVYGTLIRRSSGEVTDIHIKPARSGMTFEVRVRVGCC